MMTITFGRDVCCDDPVEVAKLGSPEFWLDVVVGLRSVSVFGV